MAARGDRRDTAVAYWMGQDGEPARAANGSERADLRSRLRELGLASRQGIVPIRHRPPSTASPFSRLNSDRIGSFHAASGQAGSRRRDPRSPQSGPYCALAEPERRPTEDSMSLSTV